MLLTKADHFPEQQFFTSELLVNNCNENLLPTKIRAHVAQNMVWGNFRVPSAMKRSPPVSSS